jgi:hypothetical protein
VAPSGLQLPPPHTPPSHFFEQQSLGTLHADPLMPHMEKLQMPPGHLPEQHSLGELHPLQFGRHMVVVPQTPFVHAFEQQSFAF